MSLSSESNKTTPSARKKARKFALQALYQWLITQDDLINISMIFYLACLKWWQS
jgi:transcription termination factor NusB